MVSGSLLFRSPVLGSMINVLCGSEFVALFLFLSIFPDLLGVCSSPFVDSPPPVSGSPFGLLLL